MDLLARGQTGVLATAEMMPDGEAQPFVSTLLYLYDAARRAVYLHTARRGRVWQNTQSGGRACFTVSEMGRLLPAKQALNFSVAYQSVVVFGRLALVNNSTEAENALQQLLDKYFPHLRPGRDYRPITPGELQATAVYCLSVETWSGKQKQVPAAAQSSSEP